MSSPPLPQGLVQPGARAPDFKLPAADREGTVSLSDYRGRSAVFLALFRGLYCPFCRWQMARLGTTVEKLAAVDVETLGVVATAPDRARLYFRFRPSRFPIGADPGLVTHHAYGLPQLPFTPEVLEFVEAAASDMAHTLGISTQPGEALQAIEAFDGFERVQSDERDAERDQVLFIGQFLIDRQGIVRWVNVERRPGDLPSDERIVAAAATL